MSNEKAVVTVFVLDTEDLTGVMDVMGNEEKHPMLHSLVTVEEDHPEIGNKLMLPDNEDGVFHAEDMVHAINKYKKAEKKDEKTETKKTNDKPSKKKSKSGKEEGKYDTKVMTPSK